MFKSSGFELTEAHLSTSYRIDSDTGVGAGYSSIRWPELERQEFEGVPDSLLEDGHLQRFYASMWRIWDAKCPPAAAPAWQCDERSVLAGGLLGPRREPLAPPYCNSSAET
jgi:hypothetical protein